MIHVLVPTWNAEPYVDRCLATLIAQEALFRAVVVDDASTDGTWNLVHQAAYRDPRFTVVRNGTRRGALTNLRATVRLAQPHVSDVLVFLDGDDWLPHQRVLERVEELYEDLNLQVTYGSARRESDGHVVPERGYDEATVLAGSYREAPWLASHLRTCRAGLFARLTDRDLVDPETGREWATAWDCALMWPLLELAGPGRARFVEEVLYVYNDRNPLADNRVDPTAQRRTELRLRARPRRVS